MASSHLTRVTKRSRFVSERSCSPTNMRGDNRRVFDGYGTDRVIPSPSVAQAACGTAWVKFFRWICTGRADYGSVLSKEKAAEELGSHSRAALGVLVKERGRTFISGRGSRLVPTRLPVLLLPSARITNARPTSSVVSATQDNGKILICTSGRKRCGTPTPG